jgi:hypothetical protein
VSRTFHLGDILSVTTGRLVSPRHIGGIHELLDYMTTDRLLTHQLPRAMDECASALLAQHPGLSTVDTPEPFAGVEQILDWLAEQIQRFGETLPVEPLAIGQHRYIDPLTELKTMVPGKPIIVVATDESTPDGAR